MKCLYLRLSAISVNLYYIIYYMCVIHHHQSFQINRSNIKMVDEGRGFIHTGAEYLGKAIGT
jgi:hypothetical protein